jgi:plastocyanin
MPSMRTTPYLQLTALLVTVLLLAGCGAVAAGITDEPGPPVAASTVRVVNNDFEPPEAEVTAGDTLTWQWEGDSDHNVVGDGFESPVQRDGTFEHTFSEPGTYAYRCTLHGWMRGTVTVGAADGQGA